MAFLGGFINSVSQMFNSIKQAVSQIFQRWDIGQGSASNAGPNVTMSVKISDAVSTAVAAIQAIKNPVTQRQLSEDVAKRAVEIVKEALRPITRSGRTAVSFQYKITNSGAVIYSNEPQVAALQVGITGTPSREKLRVWLKTKSEHSSKSEKELEKLAFLIQRSIARKNTPGPASTLKTLNPAGKRAYDYVGKTVERLFNEIEAGLGGFEL